MKKEHKEITKTMANMLSRHALLFMAGHFEGREEDTSDLINIVFSSHLSSAWDIMLKLSEEHPEIKKTVIAFIEQNEQFDFRKFMPFLYNLDKRQDSIVKELLIAFRMAVFAFTLDVVLDNPSLILTTYECNNDLKKMMKFKVNGR